MRRDEETRDDAPPPAKIECEHKGHEVHFRVRDNGCGMTATQQYRVFNAFYTTRNDGMGVGLAFVRTLLRLQEARFSAALP